MADENSLNFVHIIKETCLMKCNTLYEDQCCTSCFKSEGTKITECSSYIDFKNNNKITLALHLYTFVYTTGVRKSYIVTDEEREMDRVIRMLSFGVSRGGGAQKDETNNW